MQCGLHITAPTSDLGFNLTYSIVNSRNPQTGVYRKLIPGLVLPKFSSWFSTHSRAVIPILSACENTTTSEFRVYLQQQVTDKGSSCQRFSLTPESQGTMCWKDTTKQNSRATTVQYCTSGGAGPHHFSVGCSQTSAASLLLVLRKSFFGPPRENCSPFCSRMDIFLRRMCLKLF